MRPDRVVKSFDAGNNSGLRFNSGTETAQMNQFAFETAEEILSHGVVIKVTFAGHALAEMELSQTFTVVRGSILDAPATMKNQAL